MTSWLQWGNILVSRCLIKNQGFYKAVQEHQRRARDSVNQTVLDATARCETAVMMEPRAAQLNNESTNKMRERAILFRIGREAQAALRYQRAHMLTEQNQFVLGGREMPKDDLFGINWVANEGAYSLQLEEVGDRDRDE